MLRLSGLFNIVFLILLLLPAPLLAGAGGTGRGTAPAGLVLSKAARQAPAFELSGLGNEKVSLAAFKGKVLLMHFWASWCEPCREEFPAIKELREKYRARGFEVLAIAEDSAERVRPFARSHDLPFPVLIDQYGSVMGEYGVKVIPVTVIVNREGLVVGTLNGQGDYKDPAWAAFLEGLLEDR